MKKLIIVIVLLTLTVCSCKTKYIETVHYQPVEVHDTVNTVQHIRDSITLHDSVFIHMKNDTVYSEKWRTEHHWHTKRDTVYKSKEVPKVVTDTIVTIREVPVDKIVYKQHWWQNALSWIGGLCSLGLIISFILNKKL
jgi:hypothetical protein